MNKKNYLQEGQQIALGGMAGKEHVLHTGIYISIARNLQNRGWDAEKTEKGGIELIVKTVHSA